MYTIIPNSQINAVMTMTITISQKTSSGAPKTRRQTTVHKLYDGRSFTTTNSRKSVAPFPYDNELQL